MEMSIDLLHFTPLSTILTVFFLCAALTLTFTVGTIMVMVAMRVFKLREALILIRAIDNELQNLMKSPDIYVANVARQLYNRLHASQQKSQEKEDVIENPKQV